MFEKLDKYTVDNVYYTKYKSENPVEWMDLVNTLVDNGYEINRINAKDTLGDIGMKYGEGEYTLDGFVKYYETIREYCDALNIRLNGPYTGLMLDGLTDATLYTIDQNLDLNEMVAQKKMK